jgi:hypothetical protein
MGVYISVSNEPKINDDLSKLIEIVSDLNKNLEKISESINRLDLCHSRTENSLDSRNFKSLGNNISFVQSEQSRRSSILEKNPADMKEYCVEKVEIDARSITLYINNEYGGFTEIRYATNYMSRISTNNSRRALLFSNIITANKGSANIDDYYSHDGTKLSEYIESSKKMYAEVEDFQPGISTASTAIFVNNSGSTFASASGKNSVDNDEEVVPIINPLSPRKQTLMPQSDPDDSYPLDMAVIQTDSGATSGSSLGTA